MAGKKKGDSEEAPEDDETTDPDAEESEDGKKGKKGKKDKDEPAEEPSARAGYIGLGLVGSLVVGFDPLRDAFQGNGSFENAILRFLACVAVCVLGAGTIGRLIDASAAQDGDPEDGALDADGNPVVGSGDADAAVASQVDGADESGDDDPGDDGSEKTETISVGSASSDGSDRQGTQQQPLTSSEETP